MHCGIAPELVTSTLYIFKNILSKENDIRIEEDSEDNEETINATYCIANIQKREKLMKSLLLSPCNIHEEVLKLWLHV